MKEPSQFPKCPFCDSPDTTLTKFGQLETGECWEEWNCKSCHQGFITSGPRERYVVN